jgi:hypothetical protein
MGRRTLLDARLTATGTDMVIDGLEADTLYAGELALFPALDGAVGWQSRTVPGGSWDQGGSDYSSQIFAGFATSSSILSSASAHGQMGTIDAATTQIASLFKFSLYTGNGSRRAVVRTEAGYVTTDGTSTVTGLLFSQRVSNAAIVSIRFLNVTAASGLAAGSRAFLQRLG